jgi:TPR repeat protein
LTVHPLPSPSWRAELLAQLSPKEICAAFEGEDASDWLHAAMAGGTADAQIRLGRMLLAGEGLPLDHRAAFACFISAAAGGNPEAQNLLGRCHENGWGTKPDREAARRCYRTAAEGGDYRGAHNHACVLAAEGCLAGALHWYEKAVAGAPPPARDAILIVLRHHPRCAIRAFAEAKAADVMRSST